MKFQPRGFTLIELLVVVAIIGIISSIVLFSIRSARISARDAIIKASIDTVRKQASLYFISGSFSYGAQATTTGCAALSVGMWSDSNIAQAIARAETQSTGALILGNNGVRSVCGSGSDYWALAVVLPSNTTQLWCADSLGQSKTIPRTGAGGISSALDSFQGCI